MFIQSHQVLYPWYNDAYKHCDSCRYRDHDAALFSKDNCKRCVPSKRGPKGEEYYPTEHWKPRDTTPPSRGFWGTGEFSNSF